MKAQILERLGSMAPGSRPLQLTELPDPIPADDELLIRVSVCGVCHTELDEIEDRTRPRELPMVLGHQVVGRVIACGSRATGSPATGSPAKGPSVGDRVGVAWIFSACGTCRFCQSGRENLCPNFQATGRDRFGGYAELMTAPASFVHAIPAALADHEAAPLLCAGAIGYRALRLTQLADGQSLGLTGFGASAHLVLKMAHWKFPRTPVFVFARGARDREFARELGAVWAGDTSEPAPIALDAIIDTTPAWLPVLKALDNLAPGGRLIVNALRKEVSDQSELLRLDYPRQLWLEKQLQSVANVTRQDVREFLALAAEAQIKPSTRLFSLADANDALWELRSGGAVGAKVLVVEPPAAPARPMAQADPPSKQGA